MTQSKFLELIAQKATEMTPKLRRVTEWILNNQHDAAFLPANRIAEQLNVSQASVLRVGRLLGYDGFLEFQRALQEQLRAQVTTVERLEHARSAGIAGEDSLLYQVFELNLSNLRKTVRDLPPQAFKAAVELIGQARHVTVIGMGGGAGPVQFFAFTLGIMRPGTVGAVTEYRVGWFEEFMNTGPEDVVISFNFSRYGRAQVEMTEFAVAKGAKLVLITDSPTAPLSGLAAAVLPVATDTMSINNSYTACMGLCDALLAALALRDSERTSRNLQLWEANAIRYNTFFQTERRVTWPPKGLSEGEG